MRPGVAHSLRKVGVYFYIGKVLHLGWIPAFAGQHLLFASLDAYSAQCNPGYNSFFICYCLKDNLFSSVIELPKPSQFAIHCQKPGPESCFLA